MEKTIQLYSGIGAYWAALGISGVLARAVAPVAWEGTGKIRSYTADTHPTTRLNRAGDH